MVNLVDCCSNDGCEFGAKLEGVVSGEAVAVARAKASETRTGGRCSVDKINTPKDSAKL